MGTVTVGTYQEDVGTQPLRPGFIGVLRGELLKISRQRVAWIMVALVLATVCLVYLVEMARPGLKVHLQQTPLLALYEMMEGGLTALRIFAGPFLIVLTARLIGMEYSGGTIRVLLSRGVGRLQLLGAKLLAVSLVALALLAAGVMLATLLSLAALLIATGNLDALKSADAIFWSDAWLFVLTVAISMGVTILMAAAVTCLTRSLAAGVSVGLSFFAADNIGVIFFFLASALTHSDFWLLATGDLLGPNLNVMPDHLLSAHAVPIGGVLTGPLTPVTGGHTLLVTAIWAVLFVAAMILPTWLRDVQE